MGQQKSAKTTPLETVEPVGKRVLIRKDADKKRTKGGIELPDSVEIPTLTGRIVSVSQQVLNDDDYPIRQYDRVLFNPKHAIPVDFEADNQLYVVTADHVIRQVLSDKGIGCRLVIEPKKEKNAHDKAG